jgi:DNA polymerase III delta subunit
MEVATLRITDDGQRALKANEGTRPSILDDPEHWRERAEEARRIANRLSDPASREAMLRIAADYERIAAQAQNDGSWWAGKAVKLG